MDRALASIQIVHNITPIEKADRIETLHILGWQVVAIKGEFKVGDKVIFCEVDSILPFAEWSEFLRDKNRPDKPIRLRTVKLRKQISQGLALPLTILWDCEPFKSGLPNILKTKENTEVSFNEAQDVTELLGITKYEIPISAQLSGQVKGNFPHYCRKSDEIRLQSIKNSIFEEFHGKECYVSLKIDGTSSTFFNNAELEENGVCSRNLMLKEPEEGDKVPVYWEMERKYDILNKLKGLNIQLIGECYGEGIQKNPLGIKGHDLAIFTVFSIDRQEYLCGEDAIEMAKHLEIPFVPILERFTFDKDVHTLEYWLEYAKGKYEGTNNNREGIVIRPLLEAYSETLRGRMSVKIINNDFLLKGEE